MLPPPSQVLRARRYDAGALQLASPEVKFEIDNETHDPTDVGIYQVREGGALEGARCVGGLLMLLMGGGGEGGC